MATSGVSNRFDVLANMHNDAGESSGSGKSKSKNKKKAAPAEAAPPSKPATKASKPVAPAKSKAVVKKDKALKKAAPAPSAPVATGHSIHVIAMANGSYQMMSILVVILNKQCFDTLQQFPFPLTTTWFQMVVALVCMKLAVRAQGAFGFAGKLPEVTFNTKDLMAVLPVSVVFIAMIATGNLCLSHLQVSFFQIAKSLHIFFSLLITYVVFGEKHSNPVMFWAIMVTVGWVISTSGEPSDKFSMTGLLWGISSSIMVALYPIVLKRVMSSQQQMPKWNLSANNTLLSIFLLIPVIASSSEFPDVVAAAGRASPSFWGLMSLTAVAGFLLNIAAMANVHYTTPLSHMVSGSSKGILQTTLGVAFLGNQVTTKGFVGSVICMGAIFGYSLACHREQQAARSKAAAPAASKSKKKK